MLVVIFSLALTTPANGTIIIKAGLRLSQSLNNVALGCEDTTNLNVQLPNAVFQRAIGLDNQFMDFNYTVTNDLAEFIITPQTEGRYRCLHGGMTSDPIEVVGKQMHYTLIVDVLLHMIVFVLYGYMQGCVYASELVGR